MSEAEVVLSDNGGVVVSEDYISELIGRALKEDVQSGDVTTNAIIDESSKAKARWISKQEGVAAGLKVAKAVFKKLDPDLTWKAEIQDGDSVRQKSVLVEMEGSCRAILTAERTALNFAQRMSGIASHTQEMVEILHDYHTNILDTRKTIPGFRLLDKYAVRVGGGKNHRMGLFDMALIKDNHIVAAGGISKAVQLVKKNAPGVRVEVETTNLEEVQEALSADVDIIMLDNMSNELMLKSVHLIDKKAETEASGNITLARLQEVAETGVDYISAGALTHSVSAFDISQSLQILSK